MTGSPAQQVVAGLAQRGLTVATAESLTGGMVAAAITDVPGSSAVMRGGVVAYATDAKSSVLGVDPGLLDREGPVHPDVALQMALGVRRVMSADIAVACTGVAGPDSQGGQPPGTVYVAVVGGGAPLSERLQLAGDRSEVRAATVDHALGMVLTVLGLSPASR